MARKRQRNSIQGEILYNSLEQQEQQMESASMPQPPQNWPRNEKEVHPDNISRNDSHNLENLPDFSESGEQSKRSRGPTMMHSGWGKDGGILHVELNDLSQPIGPEGYWRLLPDLYKNKIWTDIKENTDATEDMKRILMMSVGSKWREWKHEAKSSGYDSYTNDVERLANRPDRVEEDQWRALVHYWSSTDAKKKSARNKESWKKLTMPHTSGRKSYSQIIDNMTKEKGVKPTRIDVLKKTHTKKNNEPINEKSSEVMNEMNDLAEVYPELNVPGSAPNDVYSQVMGPDTHGNVRTLGKGAAPSFVYGPLYKRSQNEQRDFDKRVEIEVQKVTSTLKIEMDEKLFEAKEEIEVMDKKLSKAEEDMEMMKKKLSEANMNMEEKIDEKVKAGILAYVDSLGITLGSNRKSFSNEQVSNKSIEDRQQSLSPVSVVDPKKLGKVLVPGLCEMQVIDCNINIE
ncbi:hypothetical protein KY290_008082 [Solanum tuberosum]|uniref:Uncharacterized protein n=1 Tax=Solanum tuberosum TaxID=4113 RepID=A0ABQ7W8R4_SOLTU|nr:hypothetical protein KY290_008082 [Solanum tuberosum]